MHKTKKNANNFVDYFSLFLSPFFLQIQYFYLKRLKKCIKFAKIHVKYIALPISNFRLKFRSKKKIAKMSSSRATVPPPLRKFSGNSPLLENIGFPDLRHNLKHLSPHQIPTTYPMHLPCTAKAFPRHQEVGYHSRSPLHRKRHLRVGTDQWNLGKDKESYSGRCQIEQEPRIYKVKIFVT